ncbi:hypothetical protein CR513_44602, partial [Mucuna pruriens]
MQFQMITLSFSKNIRRADLIELPKDVKPIGCKWIFKTKKDFKGNIERYKTYLVAKDFTQKEDINYKETFSPISSKDYFRTIMTLVAHSDLELYHMNVKIVFLNDDNNEMIYMVQLENYVNVVDDCVYHKFNKSKYIFLVLYVNDILLASSDIGLLYETKRFLTKNFKMKDLGEASFLLCPKNDHKRNEMQNVPYASVVGSLMYAQAYTCLDIAFVVELLGRYLSEPEMQH